MRIGISVITHAGQNVWENGLGQNTFHLARLFRALPFVERVVLLNCGDQDAVPSQAAEDAAEFPLLRPAEATDLIDVALEMGGALDLEWLDYIRALGKKVVFMACGQPYATLAEPNIFARGGYGARPDRCDELWVLPKDARFAPMLRVAHRCAVEVVPFLWSPVFLERSAAAVEANGQHFGWRPPPPGTHPGLRAAIFEPNISVLKSGVIPLLICDEAYRRERGAVSQLRALNTAHMVEHPTFNFLAHSLDLVKDQKAVFLAREEFAGHMATQSDLVVSHQWLNDENYLYLDALWGGYPLVHNSPWIRDLGYYYPDFDIDAGAGQVLTAWRDHADNLDGYCARARAFIAPLDPLDPANRDAYGRRLLSLAASRGVA
jgi:hypothetical protein